VKKDKFSVCMKVGREEKIFILLNNMYFAKNLLCQSCSMLKNVFTLKKVCLLKNVFFVKKFFSWLKKFFFVKK
jgi:hypothetical protein